MRKSLFVVVALAALAGQAAAQKIGYVDLHKTLDKTAIGISAKSRVKALFDKKQAELSQAEKQLRTMKDDLDKQRSLLKADAIQAKERELMQRYVALQETYVKLQQDVSKKEVELLKEIFAAAKKVIDEIATRDGYTMIFEKTESSVLYAAPGLDITDEVIKKLNGGGGGAAKAAKPARAGK